MRNLAEAKRFYDHKVAYPFSVSPETRANDLEQLRQVQVPLVILIGEHPQEGVAFRLGKKTHSQLTEAGVPIKLERFPIELTEVGSVVKGLDSINEEKVRIPLLRALYQRYSLDTYFFTFHNSRYGPNQESYGPPELEFYRLSRVTYPETEEFSNTKGFCFEIPAVWKPSRNARLQEYGEIKAQIWAVGFEQRELDLYVRMLTGKYPELTGDDLLNKAKEERDRMHAMANKHLNPDGPPRTWADVGLDYRDKFTSVTDWDKSNQLMLEANLLNLLIHEMSLYTTIQQ